MSSSSMWTRRLWSIAFPAASPARNARPLITTATTGRRSAGVCDLCGSTEFKRRPDDNEETVRTRLAEYRAKTAPILPIYEARGLVRRIDGMAPIEAVGEAIDGILGGADQAAMPR